jgi:NAD(P)-dependent dehydrogenase (short-subunit alcohol dehydrogenase family)
MVLAALITGASRGIGAATALLPAKLGYRLAVIGRSAWPNRPLAAGRTPWLSLRDRNEISSIIGVKPPR